MRIDGKEIAAHIYAALKKDIHETGITPRLGILTCAPNFETEKYLQLKQKKAHEVGIAVEVVRLPETANTEDIIHALKELTARTHGVVVQLPMPIGITVEAVIAMMPSSHDVDALNTETKSILSPVVGAIAEILKVYEIPVYERHVVVIGNGKLVGLPTSQWLMRQGAAVSVVTKDTADISYYTKNADIIVAGAGVPGLITATMVKEGVVILDAGTSEDGGVLRGDADPLVAEKASLFTPVPGGIGPITIAVLLRNVVELSRAQQVVV